MSIELILSDSIQSFQHASMPPNSLLIFPTLAQQAPLSSIR